jgi:hypothetical protein
VVVVVVESWVFRETSSHWPPWGRVGLVALGRCFSSSLVRGGHGESAGASRGSEDSKPDQSVVDVT